MANKGFLKIQKIRYMQLLSSVISEVDAKRGKFHKMLKRALSTTSTPSASNAEQLSPFRISLRNLA
jgi:hypothetical protein